MQIQCNLKCWCCTYQWSPSGCSPVTPDGYFLISASKDGQPMLRDHRGDWVGTFQGHKVCSTEVSMLGNRRTCIPASFACLAQAGVRWSTVALIFQIDTMQHALLLAKLYRTFEIPSLHQHSSSALKFGPSRSVVVRKSCGKFLWKDWQSNLGWAMQGCRLSLPAMSPFVLLRCLEMRLTHAAAEMCLGSQEPAGALHAIYCCFIVAGCRLVVRPERRSVIGSHWVGRLLCPSLECNNGRRIAQFQA